MLDKKQEQEWQKHVLAEYPNEACAFVVDGKVVPVRNIHDNPTQQFKVDPSVVVTLQGNVQGFLHSHPYDVEEEASKFPREWASEMDMIGWIKDDKPWGIVTTEGESVSDIVWYDDSIDAIEPWEGRQFISGKNDCYSIIRDYYRVELGVALKNFPREMAWWEKGRNHYLDLFAEAGFEEVPLNQIQTNDLLLVHLGTGVVTHAMLVTGNNQILHHLINRKSGYDTLAKWNRLITKAIRYVEKS